MRFSFFSLIKGKQMAIGMVVVLVTLCGAFPASGYDKEVHYGLTYFLARRVGYTVFQAQQIASADWSVDLDPDTEPVRLPAGFNILSSDQSQLIRARFHALPETNDEFTYAFTHGHFFSLAEEKHYRKTIDDRLAMLWREALSTGNPGIFLHYLQDTFAHNGYLSFTGHVFDWPLTKDPTRTFKIVRGGEKDFLDADRPAAYAMASGTWKALQQFMTEYAKKMKWDQVPCDPEQVESMVTKLTSVNPYPMMNLRIALEPDWEKAKNALEEYLHEGVPDHVQFDYDSQGNLSPNPANDDFKLTKPRPAEFLFGRWWHAGEKSGVQQVLYAKVSVSGPRGASVDFTGAKGNDWKEGVYDPISKEWRLSRKPRFEQIPEYDLSSNADVPEWARRQVQDELEWHLVLRVENCRLLATFYPGLIKWSEQTKKAWVPDGIAGWGKPREFEYKYYGARID